MWSKLIAITILSVTLFLSACSNFEDTHMDTPAQILKVYTDLAEESGWWVVPRDVSTMTVFVEAENIETVLFWQAPTGTETWSERTLIGYDKDGSDGWSLTWEFGNRILHDHIYIQVLGSDSSTQATETINVHSLTE